MSEQEEDSDAADELSFRQQVEATFDTLDEGATRTLPRHHFDVMLRLFGLSHVLSARFDGWAMLEQCEETSTPIDQIAQELLATGEITRDAAIQYFTSQMVRTAKPRFRILEEMFTLITAGDSELKLRDAQKLLRLCGIQTTLADFSLYTRVEIFEEQTGLFLVAEN